jgi:hypothetical protein
LALYGVLTCLLAGRDAHADATALPYLSEMADPTARAVGMVLAVPPGGLASLDANPAAGARSPGRGWSLSGLRVPTTRADVLTRDADGRPTAHGQLVLEGYALQVLRAGSAVTSNTWMAGEVAFRQQGPFTRVDHEGTSVHAYPETDWLLAGTAVRRLHPRLSVGASAKWLRSKQLSPEGRTVFRHGWGFDLGVDGQAASGWRIGAAVRNLGSGLSLPDPALPRRSAHDVAVGTAYVVRLSDSVHWDVTGDLRFPSKRGARFALGTGVVFGDRLGVSVGYHRDVAPLRSVRVDLATGVSATDDRLWVSEGGTFGGWTRLGDWRWSLGVSAAPTPRVGAGERSDVVTSRLQWAVGVGRRW